MELERDEIYTIVWTELGGVQTRRNITDARSRILLEGEPERAEFPVSATDRQDEPAPSWISVLGHDRPDSQPAPTVGPTGCHPTFPMKPACRHGYPPQHSGEVPEHALP